MMSTGICSRMLSLHPISSALHRLFSQLPSQLSLGIQSLRLPSSAFQSFLLHRFLLLHIHYPSYAIKPNDDGREPEANLFLFFWFCVSKRRFPQASEGSLRWVAEKKRLTLQMAALPMVS